MGVKIKQAFPEHDVVIGYGHVRSAYTKRGNPYWILPGGRRTCAQEDAVRAAKRMDQLIRYNIKRTGKALI